MSENELMMVEREFERELAADRLQEAMALDQRIKAHIAMACSNLVASAKGLKEMRDSKLYLEMGYETFEEYTVDSLGIKERQAYTYISTLEKLGEGFLQSNASLGITKLSLLSGVFPLDLDDVVEENDIAGMSVAEVKKLVEEKTQQGEQISLLKDELAEREDQINAGGEREANYKHQIEELKEQLAASKAQPVEATVSEVPDEALLAEREALVEQKAKMEYDKQLKAEKKALKEKMEEQTRKQVEKAVADEKANTEAAKHMAEEYRDKLKAMENERVAAKARAEALEKKLAVTSSPETVKFSFYFDALQQDYNKVLSALTGLPDKEAAAKFKAAMLKYCDIMKNGIEGVSV